MAELAWMVLLSGFWKERISLLRDNLIEGFEVGLGELRM